MKIESLQGFDIWESDGHGKAVKGHKKTSTIQVRQPHGPDGYLLMAQFGFLVSDPTDKAKAIEKAKKYITNKL